MGRLPAWARLAIALACGLAAAAGTLFTMDGRNRERDKLGQDFTFWWRGARAVVAGENPYAVIQPVGAYPFNGKFTYPLPAALVTVPTVPLPPTRAAAVFVGAGFAVLAYVLVGMATWRLAILLSAPALCVLGNGQWAPLLLAGMLTPALGWLLACKPTIGAALFLWKPNRKAFFGILAISAAALLVLPTWPRDFVQALIDNPHRSQYRPPLLMPGGFVLALAWLRWRRPEGRMLAALSCVPQNAFFYEQLPLMLIPSSRQGLFAFGLWTNVLLIVARVIAPLAVYTTTEERSAALEPFVIAGLFVPALVIVLRRPNEGDVPPWLERFVSRVPAWLRGRREVQA